MHNGNSFRFIAVLLLLLTFCTTGFSQTISESLFSQNQKKQQQADQKTISLEKLIKKIESDQHIVFLYKTTWLKDKYVPASTLEQDSLEFKLGAILQKEGLTYSKITPRSYAIRPQTDVVDKSNKPVQVETVTGMVTDANTGETLPGVNVMVKGTTTGISTGSEGRYELNAPSLQDTLLFSFVGYQTQEVPIEGRTTIDVALQAEAIQGEEMVVVGYGTVQKSDLTGSVTSVGDEEIDSYPAGDVMQALAGRASGVEVLQNTGAPGPEVNIRIRGTNSIYGDNDPLYIVDGFPLSGQPTNIANSEIESIEILKDASATAIYGSRGANGVVIITTKDGINGNTQVDFQASYSIQTLRKKLDLLNAREYAQVINMTAEAGNLAPYFTQEEINNFGEGTDWQDLVFQNAPIYNSSITISGGDERTQFSIGGSLFEQEGIIKGSDFNRYSLRTKVNHDISNKFRIDLSSTLTHSISGRKDSQGGGRGGSMINAAITAPPTAIPYNDDGTINDIALVHPFLATDMHNPLYFINEESTEIKENIVLGNAALIYDLTPNLSVKISGGIENRDSRTDIFRSREFRNSDGFAEVSIGNFTSILSENTINYNRIFGDRHEISAVGGFTYQSFVTEGLEANGQGFLSNVFETGNLEAANSPGIPSSDFIDSTILSYLGRVNYSFNDKYLLTASFRADGSSRFSEGNKWGYFPSGALAWRISEEDFLREHNFITDLKVRASWGLTGSQAIEPYTTLNRLHTGNTVFGDALFTTFAPGEILPADLRWETTEQIDIGAEIGILNDRFHLTADYFIKNTKDLLNIVGLPGTIGYTQTVRNIGKVQNKGFEFSINTHLLSASDFNWTIDANASFLRNKVKKLAEGKDILVNNPSSPIYIGGDLGILREGRPLGQFWGFLEDGYTDQGAIKYRDLNRDGEITAEDKTYIGNPNPDVIFGFNSKLSYKNFELIFFLQGSIGNEIFNLSSAASTLGHSNGGLNVLKEVFTDHWTPDNTDAKYPAISLQATSSADISDRFVEDGSYVRLKNIELAYTLPLQSFGISGMKDFQIYVSGQDLLTLTGYSWWDPEVNSTGLDTNKGVDYFSYPNAKVLTGGIRLGF